MEQLTASVEPMPLPEEPSAPPKPSRAVPLWAALGLTLAGALVAFGIGFAIHAADAGAASERDELTATVVRVTGEREKAESSLAVAEGSLDECQDAVDEASILADEAAAFSSDWRELDDLFLRWAATAVGSPEEAELDMQIADLTLQMQTNVGVLSGAADRVAEDTTCRST